MTQQLDLFAGNQVDLFTAPPAMLAPAVAPRRLGGRPASVDAAWERASTAEVRQLFLDVAIARPGEWIDGSTFYNAVAIPQRIGCCWGHAMGAMARAGLLEVKNHYYGSDHPGKPGYKGYNHLYRWHPPMLGVAHA